MYGEAPCAPSDLLSSRQILLHNTNNHSNNHSNSHSNPLQPEASYAHTTTQFPLSSGGHTPCRITLSDMTSALAFFFSTTAATISSSTRLTWHAHAHELQHMAPVLCSRENHGENQHERKGGAE